MKIIAIVFAALSILSPLAHAGRFQDTLDDIDSQLQEINQRTRDQEFDAFLQHASRPALLTFLRDLAPFERWARELLIQYGDASDRARYKIDLSDDTPHGRWTISR